MTSKLNINWLNKCRCGNRMHTVETVRGSHVRLFEDDAVKCNSCGREGVIQTCDGIATVLWETDAERAEGAAMTKSTITRERLEEIRDYDTCVTLEESAELARMALAAMDQKPALHRYRRKAVEPYGPYPWHYEVLVDCPRPVEGIEDEYFYAAPPAVTGFAVDSEPYGYVHQSVYEQSGSCGLSNDHEAYRDSKTHIPLYRHAQQPVVDIEPTQMFGIGSIFKPQVVSEQEADCDDCAHYNPKICHGEGCPAISQQSAQPAPERDQVRREHAEWSQATFGNVGPIGPLKHLRKEALEAIAKPQDLIEWADMQFLLWDAQRRAGITDEQITLAMIEKLAVNKQREWPEPKDGESRLHIKELPAPVVPDIDELRLAFEAAERESDDGFNLHKYGIGYADDETQGRWDTWLACRAAMLQARSLTGINPAPALVSFPKTGEVLTTNSPAQSDCSPAQNHVFPALNPIDHGYRPDCECSGCKATARICAELAGNSPVIPDTWIPVSERMPENGVSVLTFDGMYRRVHHAMYGHWQCREPEKITHWMPLPAAPQEVKSEHRIRDEMDMGARITSHRFKV